MPRAGHKVRLIRFLISALYCLLVYLVGFPTYPFFLQFFLFISSLTCLFLGE